MKQEIKNLLHRLLWSVMQNGLAGVHNAFMDKKAENAEYEFDYALDAMKELSHLEKGEKVDFKKVVDAIDASMPYKGYEDIKDKITGILDYGYIRALEDFGDTEEKKEKEIELGKMYHPSDELMNELVEILEIIMK